MAAGFLKFLRPVTGTQQAFGLVNTAFGYATGSSVTQLTDKSTGVTINAPAGVITCNNAQLNAAAEVSFVVTNNFVAAVDVPLVAIASVFTAGSYLLSVSAVAAGTFTITLSNVSAGNLSEAGVINFVILKGSSTAV